MTWYIIETLVPPAMSVISKDGDERDWTSVHGLTRSHGIDDVERVLHRIRETGDTFDQLVTGRRGPRRVVAIPVRGHEGDVYGIKVWVGDTDEEVTAEPAVGPVAVFPETFTVKHTIESYLMSSTSADGFGDTRDPGQFLRKVVEFDALTELVEVCQNNGTRSRFQTPLLILHDDGHLMKWRGLGKGNAGPDGREVRGLFHDVTEIDPPVVTPLTALRMSPPTGEDSAAMLIGWRQDTGSDTDSHDVPAIIYWFTPRPDYLAESAVAVARAHGTETGNLIHPDDYPLFRQAREVLRENDDEHEVPLPTRLLDKDGGYAAVEVTLRRYPTVVKGAGSILQLGRVIRTSAAAG